MITGYIIEKCDDGTDKWLRCNARLCPDLSYRVRSDTVFAEFSISLNKRKIQFDAKYF